MACLVEDEYAGPEILHKIVNADLLITEEIKTVDSNGQHRFAYKFTPLPLHPNQIKSNNNYQPKKKKKGDENVKVIEEDPKHAGLYHRKDGVLLHNAMAVCFHPFMIGFDPLAKQDQEGQKPNQIWYKAMLLPLLMNYFEKSCYLKDINYELFSEEWKPLEQKLPARFGNDEGQRGELSRASDQASFLKYYVKPGEQLITKSKAAASKI